MTLGGGTDEDSGPTSHVARLPEALAHVLPHDAEWLAPPNV